MLSRLKVRDLLSFGSAGATIEFGRLNVLIGPNASGKSNLIDLIALLRSTTTDVAAQVREGGGIREWLWRGAPQDPDREGVLTAEVSLGALGLVSHKLGLQSEAGRLAPLKERVSWTDAGLPAPGTATTDLVGGGEQSLLALHFDASKMPVLAALRGLYRRIGIYRSWSFGRGSGIGVLERADQLDDVLRSDFRNLALVLRRFYNDSARVRNWQKLEDHVRDVYPGFRGVKTPTTGAQGDYVELLVMEEGLSEATPATRLSDGTLRYLALLTLLLDPSPPPIICLEEPELGLHPDLVHVLARLLVEASERTQIILTTHSEQLVSALSEQPEAILVCERDEEGTRARHLDGARLARWLEKYTLGELWRSGELGGNRW